MRTTRARAAAVSTPHSAAARATSRSLAPSMTTIQSKAAKSAAVSGRLRLVSVTPRAEAAEDMRPSGGSPSWYEYPPGVHQLEEPPPVPQESMTIGSGEGGAADTSERNMPSAAGERQILPRHKNRTPTLSGEEDIVQAEEEEAERWARGGTKSQPLPRRAASAGDGWEGSRRCTRLPAWLPQRKVAPVVDVRKPRAPCILGPRESVATSSGDGVGQ